MNKPLLILSIFLMTAAGGCSIYHIHSEDVSADYYPSKANADEVVYLEEVTRPNKVIGQVTVNAERRQSIDEVILKIKREAAVLGGDAITNLQTDATGNWKKLPAQQLIGNGYIRANFSATVVAFQ